MVLAGICGERGPILSEVTCYGGWENKYQCNSYCGSGGVMLGEEGKYVSAYWVLTLRTWSSWARAVEVIAVVVCRASRSETSVCLA